MKIFKFKFVFLEGKSFFVGKDKKTGKKLHILCNWSCILYNKFTVLFGKLFFYNSFLYKYKNVV